MFDASCTTEVVEGWQSNSMGFPCGSAGKQSTCNAEDLGWKDPLEEGKATHSSIPAWRIPGTV